MDAWMVIELRRASGRRVQVFVGPDKGHLQLAGELFLDTGEAQLLGAALILGAQHMQGRLSVIAPGPTKFEREGS